MVRDSEQETANFFDYLRERKKNPWLKVIDFIRRLFWKISYFPKYLYYDVKYFTQRGRRGFSDRDLWNINDHLIMLIPSMIRAWQKKGLMGHPADLTEGQWSGILNEIAGGFEYYMRVENLLYDGDTDQYIKDYAKAIKGVNKSFKLITKHWGGLWD